ncbi:MAG: epoxyqueuosine reductase [Halanaerobiaceae bacterium]|nr:epoxyqueuosine reductase [Halanaerobiaceae bacterium]
MKDKTKIIRRYLKDLGADLTGFADLSGLASSIRSDMLYGISIGKKIRPEIIESLKDGPNKQYYEEYTNLNNTLHDIAHSISRIINEMGYTAIAKSPTEMSIGLDNLGAELPHKTVATRAGIGWIGKCALLVTEKYGSAIRLTTVLTDMDLETDQPINGSKCGDCRKCKDYCTGNAVRGINWDISKGREEIYDAYLCMQEARRLSGLKGINEILCGRCIYICPYTRKYVQSGL